MPDTTEFRPANTEKPQNKVNREVRGENRNGPDPEVSLEDIMPIASYEGEKGYPYVVDYYKLDTPYEFLDTPIRNDLEAIDVFIKGYIKDENKEDTILSYAKTMRNLEKKLGVDDNTIRTEAIKKIANLVRNYRKVSDAFSKNIKRKVLAKLIRLVQEGSSSYDQEEYLLEKMGGLV